MDDVGDVGSGRDVVGDFVTVSVQVGADEFVEVAVAGESGLDGWGVLGASYFVAVDTERLLEFFVRYVGFVVAFDAVQWFNVSSKVDRGSFREPLSSEAILFVMAQVGAWYKWQVFLL